MSIEVLWVVVNRGGAEGCLIEWALKLTPFVDGTFVIVLARNDAEAE